MSIDYRTLLAQQLEVDWEVEVETVYPHDDAPYTELTVLASPDEVADTVLATRIPDLCPDCMVSGECEQYPCSHPNAPTIADLLRWGENVAKAEPFDRCRVATSGGKWTYAHALLAALRTEADR